uniref:Bm671, isoform a n=1 Tax=Brugia malayi TaxID=6279 RepID=A0A1I9G4G6_BRUMA|nr:Bm671, isoform a [Brugia malayi]
MSIRYRRMKFQNTEQQSGLFSGPLEIYILLHYKSITLKRQEEIFLEYSNIRNRLEVFGKFKYKQERYRVVICCVPLQGISCNILIQEREFTQYIIFIALFAYSV